LLILKGYVAGVLDDMENMGVKWWKI